MINLDQTIIKPIITEKSTQQTTVNKYTFEVNQKASKRDVSWAVTELFGVEVYDVHIHNRRGRTHQVGKQRKTVTDRTRRIAIVTINPKQHIDIFEQEEA